MVKGGFKKLKKNLNSIHCNLLEQTRTDRESHKPASNKLNITFFLSLIFSPDPFELKRPGYLNPLDLRPKVTSGPVFLGDQKTDLPRTDNFSFFAILFCVSSQPSTFSIF